MFQANAAWLSDRFWMPRTNRLVFTYQLWLVKSRDAIVLIDTGCGNHKARVSPYQNMVNTPVIDWLQAVGAAPEEVTHVLHTHVHCDHVGWNTRLMDGKWVPTFPNATYYMPRLDYEYFAGRQARRMGPEMYEGVLADSVLPVLEAGLVRYIEPGDEVAGFVASATPGHTPGHLSYTLCHRGERIIFAGDVLHTPLQVMFPHLNSRWCEDPRQARLTRAALLRAAAESGATLIPAHAQQIGGWRVAKRGEGFCVGFEESSIAAQELPEPQAGLVTAEAGR
jgi:glyoxylase-like metal-dependent hydrolase (beta-lactamase superfamily II)